jgi:hypothetical protein
MTGMSLTQNPKLPLKSWCSDQQLTMLYIRKTAGNRVMCHLYDHNRNARYMLEDIGHFFPTEDLFLVIINYYKLAYSI